MSILYDNVLRLSSHVANAVCEHFKETDTVCPPIRIHVFTTAAVDNIDHNAFFANRYKFVPRYGTSISLIQHPTVEGEGVDNASIKLRNVSTAKTIAPLPSSYINISPIFKSKRGSQSAKYTV